ncbi:MAG: M15 family metallopeptidase [Ornithinimicrobium sp.]|uniref:M15 family metallopeptidase n=1 Tax=Ornithinimicrobium sp. TaxID=1977084 RepID=UPI0026DED367|nr:M15 family metallopeptidase [Ornithinimicrobium sp.]MDO5741276.1 M15 family metallopeptidase [Ornithinimicrobium sp.]
MQLDAHLTRRERRRRRAWRRRLAGLGVLATAVLTAAAAGAGLGLPQLLDRAPGGPPVAAWVSIAGAEQLDGPDRAVGTGDRALTPGEVECQRPADGAADFLRDTGAAGAGALGAVGFGCLGSLADGLPPTQLEQEDAQRLYTLVTRDEAIRPTTYAPTDLVAFRGGPYEVRKEVAQQLGLLFDAAARDGHTMLVVTSGFRAYDIQAGTHEDWVGRVGSARADQISALPGHSEHQLGLAVDLGGSCTYDCFGAQEDGRWVGANAHRWGFIIRYPEGGQKVTGYAPEPWHLRYVGPQAAWRMHLDGQAYWERAQPQFVRQD